MRSALLALLLALPALAEPRTVLEVRKGSLELVGGEMVTVVGGAYLPPESLLANGKELAALRAENAALKEDPVSTPPAILGVGVICLVLGFVAGAYAVVKLR